MQEKGSLGLLNVVVERSYGANGGAISVKVPPRPAPALLVALPASPLARPGVPHGQRHTQRPAFRLAPTATGAPTTRARVPPSPLFLPLEQNGNEVTMTSVSFENNHAGSQGGAVAMQGNLLCTACSFSSNRATLGGAVAVGASTWVGFADYTFHQNLALKTGGERGIQTVSSETE